MDEMKVRFLVAHPVAVDGVRVVHYQEGDEKSFPSFIAIMLVDAGFAELMDDSDTEELKDDSDTKDEKTDITPQKKLEVKPQAKSERK